MLMLRKYFLHVDAKKGRVRSCLFFSANLGGQHKDLFDLLRSRQAI